MREKVIKKLSAKPTLGTFYIIEDAIYYSTIDHGIDHSKFWQMLVPEIFPTLAYENKKELMNAPYGVERGRVSWTGDMVGNAPTGKGKYVIYGTPGSKPFEKELMSAFGLRGLPKEKLDTDFASDGHYKIQKQDQEIFKENYGLVKDKVELKTTHFANAIKGSELYAKIQKKISSLTF